MTPISGHSLTLSCAAACGLARSRQTLEVKVVEVTAAEADQEIVGTAWRSVEGERQAVTGRYPNEAKPLSRDVRKFSNFRSMRTGRHARCGGFSQMKTGSFDVRCLRIHTLSATLKARPSPD